MSNERNPTKASSATHSYLSKYSLRTNIAAFTKLLCWFKDTADFDESEDKIKMLSFSTGLISQKGKNNVNAEECFSVGTALQKKLGGNSFITKFRVKGKVGNLTLLKRTVRVNEKDIVIDSMTIFNRFFFASERESTLEDSLRYELTAMLMRLFNNEQMMRKANKAVFGQHLKNVVDCTVTYSNPSASLIIDGGWLLYQINSCTGFETYGDIANEYIKLVPKPEQRKVIVVFDGYA